MDKKYNSYHTAIKTCFALGIQQVVLPDTFTNTIPRSTSQNWKDLDAQKFVGSEYAIKVELDIEEVKLFLDERLKKLRIMFISFCRLYLSILHFIGKDNFKKLILQNKEHVIDLVNHLPIEINRSMICKFLQISHHQFQVWNKNRSFKCASSLIGYCTKRFPNQIAQKELNTLKSIMSRHRFQTWSNGA